MLLCGLGPRHFCCWVSLNVFLETLIDNVSDPAQEELSW